MRPIAIALLLSATLVQPVFAADPVGVMASPIRGSIDEIGEARPGRNMAQRMFQAASAAETQGKAFVTELQGAVETAQATNPTVRAAVLETRAAELRVWRELVSFLPTIDAGYDISLAHDDGAASSSLTDDGDFLSVTARLPLYTGGQRYYGIKGAQERARAAAYQASSVRGELTLQVLDAWLRVATGAREIKILRRSLRRLKSLRTAVAAQRERGFASRDDLGLVDADVASVRRTLTEAEADQERARADLRRRAGSGIKANGSLLALDPYLAGDKIWLLESAKRNNPALRAASAAYYGQLYDTRASIGRHLPRVDLTGQYRYATRPTRDVDDRDSWNIGLQVRVPILNAANWVDSFEQDTLTQAALAREAETLRTVEHQVEILWADLEGANDAVKALSRERRERQEAAVAARNRFDRGFGTLDTAVQRAREADQIEIAELRAQVSRQLVIGQLLVTAGLFDTTMLSGS